MEHWNTDCINNHWMAQNRNKFSLVKVFLPPVLGVLPPVPTVGLYYSASVTGTVKWSAFLYHLFG